MTGGKRVVRMANVNGIDQTNSSPELPDTDNLSGLIKRYDKYKRASSTPLAMDWIKATYEHAIEYAGIPKGLRGAALSMGITFGLGAGGAMTWMAISVLFWEGWIFKSIAIVWLIGIIAFMLYMVLSSIRLELFSPEDAPTLFDRQHRKVYRIARASKPGFKGLFQPWPLVSDDYDWDLVDAEHRAVLITTGTTAYRQHSLVFTVRQSADDPTIVDEFQLGNALVLNDALTDGVWEHIRRFMEEGGPHLPPGQSMADRTPPTTWWQSMGEVGVFGPKYFKSWRERFGMTLISHIGIVVFLPMNLLWGTGNWLSYKTARPVNWSPEVISAIGPKIKG
jgi:hypothetical protein